MARGQLLKGRRLHPALFRRIGTAGVEMTARRRVNRARYIPVQDHLLAFDFRVRDRHR